MKTCPQYVEELACCAAGDEVPSSKLAAHLRSCGHCRDTLNELRQTAALQTRVAAELKDPSVSLSWAFINSFRARERRPATIFLKPALIVSGVAVVVAILLANRGSQKTPAPAVVLSEAPSAQRTWQPTWQRLREGVDTLPTSHGGGSVMAHYRIKDAYSDLN